MNSEYITLEELCRWVDVQESKRSPQDKVLCPIVKELTTAYFTLRIVSEAFGIHLPNEKILLEMPSESVKK
jgi:hypothetical protein